MTEDKPHGLTGKRSNAYKGKGARIHMIVKPAEKEAWQLAAEELGKNLTDLIVDRVNSHPQVRKVLKNMKKPVD